MLVDAGVGCPDEQSGEVGDVGVEGLLMLFDQGLGFQDARLDGRQFLLLGQRVLLLARGGFGGLGWKARQQAAQPRDDALAVGMMLGAGPERDRVPPGWPCARSLAGIIAFRLSMLTMFGIPSSL